MFFRLPKMNHVSKDFDRILKSWSRNMIGIECQKKAALTLLKLWCFVKDYVCGARCWWV